MELRDLRFFCLTAELGSVTRAAEQLGVSQPFVTKVIHHLEEELGTQLFDIERRRIVLNENGSYFYREAREIVDRADRLTGNMAAKREQSKFTIQLLYNNAGYLNLLFRQALFRIDLYRLVRLQNVRFRLDCEYCTPPQQLQLSLE